MSEGKILIVEDERNIADLVKYNLEKNNYYCVTTSNGEEALSILGKQTFDLIILDLMLPKMDGLDVCRHIRRDNNTSSIPVIMLTAKGEETDRIVGFELGATDYVVKPFSPRELVLRVKSLLKHFGAEEDESCVLTADKLKVDISRHKVTVEDEDIELTSMEFKLLVLLMRRKGRALSRDNILTDVWDIAADVTTRTIDTHVKSLRKKLGKMGCLIETVRGMGYRFSEID